MGFGIFREKFWSMKMAQTKKQKREKALEKLQNEFKLLSENREKIQSISTFSIRPSYTETRLFSEIKSLERKLGISNGS